MKFKQSVIAFITFIGICSCNQPGTNNKTSDAAANVQAALPVNYLDSFKQTKNEPAFLASLYNAYAQKLMADGLGKFELKAKTDDDRPYKLLKLEEIKLYGSTAPCTLAYVDEIDGAMAGWPWKNLFVLNDTGKILYSYQTGKYEPVTVFDHNDPLLMMTDETSKGNGIHHFFGIAHDTIKDFLDTKEWTVLTINANKYTPEVLPFEVTDLDGQKAIVFKGKKDNKPFELRFIWNEQTKTFEPKNN